MGNIQGENQSQNNSNRNRGEACFLSCCKHLRNHKTNKAE